MLSGHRRKFPNRSGLAINKLQETPDAPISPDCNATCPSAQDCPALSHRGFISATVFMYVASSTSPRNQPLLSKGVPSSAMCHTQAHRSPLTPCLSCEGRFKTWKLSLYVANLIVCILYSCYQNLDVQSRSYIVHRSRRLGSQYSLWVSSGHGCLDMEPMCCFDEPDNLKRSWFSGERDGGLCLEWMDKLIKCTVRGGGC